LVAEVTGAAQAATEMDDINEPEVSRAFFFPPLEAPG
jgi:hypothetical protein